MIHAAITNSDKSYLIYMAIRLLEMKRLLKSTGSIYLHCDPTMSHYLKLVMDAIFGKENYRAEIIWNRQSSHNDKLYGATHETIFYYSYGEKTIPNEVLIPLKDKRKKAFNKSDKHGKYEADNLKGSRSSSGESGQSWQGLFQEIVARTDIPKRMDLGDIPPYNSPENKTRLYGEQSGNCNGCGEHFQKQHLETDHIIARSVGGTDHIENLQLLCGHCNRIKGDRGQEYLISRLNAS